MKKCYICKLKFPDDYMFEHCSLYICYECLDNIINLELEDKNHQEFERKKRLYNKVYVNHDKQRD